MTVRDVVSHQLKAVSRKRCLMSFSQAPILPCSRALLFALLLSTPAVVTAQWEPDVRLTFNDSVSVTSYNNARCIATSAGGLVHVVWRDNRDGNDEVYYKRSTDSGLSWFPDTRISYDQYFSENPSLAVSGRNVHIVWADDRNRSAGYLDIYYRHSPDGGVTWSPEIRLTSDIWDSQYPSVAVSDTMVHVVWVDSRDTNTEIYYKRSSDSGTTWSPDTRLTMARFSSEFPSIAVSGSTVHVAWVDERDGNPEIYYKRSADSGLTWSSDTRLTIDPNLSEYTSICALGDTVHLCWADSRNPRWQIYYKRSVDGGLSWTADTCLTNAIRVDYFVPSVSASGQNVHLVWGESDFSLWNTEIFYMRSKTSGLTWEPETCLTNAYEFSHLPSVAVSDSLVHVAWSDGRNSQNGEIYYKRNPTGNPIGIEVNPNKEAFGSMGYIVAPNPFWSYATIRGHESDLFAIYDISGSLRGKYYGVRIGSDLPPGVYFLKNLTWIGRPRRIVKLR